LTHPRRVAWNILQAVTRGRRLDLALLEEGAGLSDRDRRWVHEAVYGTVRLRGRLDHLLSLRVHRGLTRVSPPVLDLLRLGAYQLLCMGGVPGYAAVSQSVDHARALGGSGAAGLVNAVLRAVSRAGMDPRLFPSLEEDPAGYLSSWGSHPRWLVERWLRRWSPGAVASLVEANNSVPPVTLRPVGIPVEAAISRLRAEGIGAVAVGRGTGCLELERRESVAAALQQIPAVVQDPGAALVTGGYAHPLPPGPVADLCAAPGGKALTLASPEVYVLAADPSLPRLRVLQENVGRLGLRVGVVAARGEAPPVRGCPTVLLDVPCTGTGTLRRHPDARWRLRPQDIGVLARLQEGILEGGAAVLPTGGVLLYSTCTLEPEENEEQVRAFLRRHREFRLSPGGGEAEAEWIDGEGFLRVLPGSDGFDGAFAARLVREEA